MWIDPFFSQKAHSQVSCPQELEEILHTIQKGAPEVVERALADAGSFEIKLCIPGKVVPKRPLSLENDILQFKGSIDHLVTRLFRWVTGTGSYVFLEDLRPYSLNTTRFATTTIQGKKAVFITELARHHIEIADFDGSAFWDLKKRTLYLFATSRKKLGDLVFELGNAANTSFYSNLWSKKLTQQTFIETVEKKEWEVYRQTSEALKKLGVPYKDNWQRFRFPWNIHLLHQEVSGHIDAVSHLYSAILPPPPTRWKHPVSPKDRITLKGLIYWIGVLNFDPPLEHPHARKQIQALESRLEAPENWAWFKALCQEEKLAYN